MTCGTLPDPGALVTFYAAMPFTIERLSDPTVAIKLDAGSIVLVLSCERDPNPSDTRLLVLSGRGVGRVYASFMREVS